MYTRMPHAVPVAVCSQHTHSFCSRMHPQGGTGEEEKESSGAAVGATSDVLSHNAPHDRGPRSRRQELAVEGHRERFAWLGTNVDLQLSPTLCYCDVLFPTSAFHARARVFPKG